MGQSLELLEQRLRNRRILVVEDEAPIVVMAESSLTELGCRVYLAQNMRRAHKIAKTKNIDCALLDIRIGSDKVFSVADLLAASNVPMVFSSGYDQDALPDRYKTCIILSKPYLFSDVVRALVTAMSPDTHRWEGARFGSAAATGHAHAPQPDDSHRYQDAGSTDRPTGER